MTKPDILERMCSHPCEDNPDYGPLLCGLRVEAMGEIKTLRTRISTLEDNAHYSDCPVNNAPALPVGECDCLEKARARVAELEAALREAYEVYAGSDGFIPETAAEGYQQQLIKQMVDIIGAALDKSSPA